MLHRARCRLGNVVADLHEHFHNTGMCRQRIVWNGCRRLPRVIASWIDSLGKRFKGSVGTGGVQPVATGSGEPRGAPSSAPALSALQRHPQQPDDAYRRTTVGGRTRFRFWDAGIREIALRHERTRGRNPRRPINTRLMLRPPLELIRHRASSYSTTDLCGGCGNGSLRRSVRMLPQLGLRHRLCPASARRAQR